MFEQMFGFKAFFGCSSVGSLWDSFLGTFLWFEALGRSFSFFLVGGLFSKSYRSVCYVLHSRAQLLAFAAWTISFFCLGEVVFRETKRVFLIGAHLPVRLPSVFFPCGGLA